MMSKFTTKSKSKPLRFSTVYHYGSLYQDSVENILERIQASSRFSHGIISNCTLKKDEVLIGTNRPLSISGWDLVYGLGITKTTSEWSKFKSIAEAHSARLGLLKLKNPVQAIQITVNGKTFYFVSRKQLCLHRWLSPHDFCENKAQSAKSSYRIKK